MSTHCPDRLVLPKLSSHYTLDAAMQASYMVEWMHDFTPVVEVHRGREWELMDLCFMTCFTGTLPFSVTLAHLWFIMQSVILFIQSWQPCIIHPSPSVLLLCLSWFSFFCLCLCVSIYVLIHLSRSPSPVSLLLSSWLRRCSPCTPRRCCSCLNGTALIWPACCHHAGKKLCSFSQCS